MAVIEKITRKCHEIEHAHTQGMCGERERCSIESCQRNLGRIEYLISPETNNKLKISETSLQISETSLQISETSFRLVKTPLIKIPFKISITVT